MNVTEAVAAMQGATLECLEILEVMRTALPPLEADAGLGPAELPLLRQLIAVVHGAPIAMPFADFVRGVR